MQQAIGTQDPESSQDRAQVIMHILEHTPGAATIKNSHGNLPIHAICSRNVRFDKAAKDRLRKALAEAYPAGLLTQSKRGKTPLHILMGDASVDITYFFLQHGSEAVFLKDDQGHLPIHEAARYKPALKQMQALLKWNPSSIAEKTGAGMTVLELAEKSTQFPKIARAMLENALKAHRRQQEGGYQSDPFDTSTENYKVNGI